MALFYPVDPNRTLKQQYKEFAETPEFKDLSKSEEIFVWGYACSGSPNIGIEDRYERAKVTVELMEKMKGEGYKPKEGERQKYLNLQFAEKIKSAIDVISSFKVTERMEANEAMKNMQKNLIKIANLDAEEIMWKQDENGVKYFDASGVNQFVATIQRVTEELPKIVRLNEEGMGISPSVSIDLASGRSAHQVFMDRQKDKVKN